jgi:hypothetical protein
MGGDDSASKAAAAQQAQQQASIAQSTAAVNSIFDNPSRTAQYNQLGSDTTAYYTQQLDNQNAINDRNMKFAQARGGQTGGSVATDQTAQAGKDYLAGVLDAQRRGQAASAGLESSDETERANLIAAAQGGESATQIASQSADALKSNLDTANSANTSNAFGDTFGDMASIYSSSQQAAALRNGQRYAYNTVYQPGFGYGAGSTGTPGYQ